MGKTWASEDPLIPVGGDSSRAMRLEKDSPCI